MSTTTAFPRPSSCCSHWGPRFLKMLIFSSLPTLALSSIGCGGEDDFLTCGSSICPEGWQCAARHQVCISDACGNGILDEGEECDDGNILDNDGCSAKCKVEKCGDGTQQKQKLTYYEHPADSLNASGEVIEYGSNGIPKILKAEAGEVCDWGEVGAENCSKDCTSNLKCGNGIVDEGEVCDNGLGVLGADGVWNPPTTGTETCSQNCDSEIICGNGILDNYAYLSNAKYEQCDPGTQYKEGVAPEDVLGAIFPDGTHESAVCLETCIIQLCGDGKVTGEEQCDTNTIGGATYACNSDCTISVCGDGKLNAMANEACDDGSLEDESQWDTVESVDENGNPQTQKVWKGTATCTSTCTINKCGDYHVGEFQKTDENGQAYTFKEECDRGPQGDATCTADCTINICGDRYIGTITREDGTTFEEECDDGPGGSYRCTTSCTVSFCGDGIVNTLAGETCDHGLGAGSAVGTADCNKDCTTVGCGDGMVNEAAGEECDPNSGVTTDPKVASGDSIRCTKYCKNSSCGDGYVNSEAQEQCDPGLENAENPPNEAGYWAGCNNDCTISYCGDGVVNEKDEEACDPGTGYTAETPRVANADALRCTKYCKVSSCGDGHVNAEAQEQCDPGDTAEKNEAGYWAGCNNDCTRSYCGDGVINEMDQEQCDHGKGENSLIGSIRCNSDCTNSQCGDGKVNGEAGETCDPGDTEPKNEAGYWASCNSDCTVSKCGDGIINAMAGETCDPGTVTETGFWETCNVNCTISRCGDGIVNPAAGEECDPGDDGDWTACNSDCTNSKCGDGKINSYIPAGSTSPIEACDPGDASRQSLIAEGGTLETTDWPDCLSDCTAVI